VRIQDLRDVRDFRMWSIWPFVVVYASGRRLPQIAGWVIAIGLLIRVAFVLGEEEPNVTARY